MTSRTEQADIHPSSIVSDETVLGEQVLIGPGCYLQGRVTLGDRVKLIGGVHLRGPVTIGAGTSVYPFACLGFSAQDYKVKPDDPTPGVVIGSDCLIREHVTIHSSTRQDRPTTLGDGVFMMVGAHAGHDVQIGNRAVVVNNVALGGHIEVGERANLGGHAAIHQFVRIGRLAMVGGNATLTADVPPFCIVVERNAIHGLNVHGLRRAGVPREQITLLRAVYREVLRTRRARSEVIDGLTRIGGGDPLVEELIEFYRTSKRGVAMSAALPPRQFRAWLRKTQEMPEDLEGAEDEVDAL